jgi:hypothetical protein
MKDTVVGWDVAAFKTAMGGSATYQMASAGAVGVALANALNINKDATSSFIRRPSGGLSKEEEQVVASIKTKHNLWSGIPVRVFPRSIDAALLGGLKSVIGSQYSLSRSVSAKYFIRGNSIGLGEIRSEGVIINGSFILPKSRSCT